MDSGGFPFKASCCFIEFLDNAFEQVSVSPYLHKVGLAVGPPSSLETMNLLHMLARRTWREYGALNYHLYEDCSGFDLRSPCEWGYFGFDRVIVYAIANYPSEGIRGMGSDTRPRREEDGERGGKEG